MNFWLFFLFSIFIPLVMVLCGFLMWKVCAKKTNSWAGYRTLKSLKNDITWKFANEYCGKLWVIIGAILLIVIVPTSFIFYSSDESILMLANSIIITVECLLLAGSIVPTEIALKKLV